MMQPKDLVLATLRHEKTEQVPWVPFAGVHAGLLLGYDAEEVLTDGDKLLASLLEVNKLYRPAGSRWCLICSWKRKFWAVIWYGLRTVLRPLRLTRWKKIR